MARITINETKRLLAETQAIQQVLLDMKLHLEQRAAPEAGARKAKGRPDGRPFPVCSVGGLPLVRAARGAPGRAARCRLSAAVLAAGLP